MAGRVLLYAGLAALAVFLFSRTEDIREQTGEVGRAVGVIEREIIRRQEIRPICFTGNRALCRRFIVTADTPRLGHLRMMVRRELRARRRAERQRLRALRRATREARARQRRAAEARELGGPPPLPGESTGGGDAQQPPSGGQQPDPPPGGSPEPAPQTGPPFGQGQGQGPSPGKGRPAEKGPPPGQGKK